MSTRAAPSSADRVIRGGSWIHDADRTRSAYRNGRHAGNRNNNVGFRVVLPPPNPRSAEVGRNLEQEPRSSRSPFR